MIAQGTETHDRFGRDRAKLADLTKRIKYADDVKEAIEAYKEFIAYTADRRVAGLEPRPPITTAGIDNDLYMLASTGVSSEAGELNDVMKKVIYHDHASLETMAQKRRDAAISEAGDLMWYFFLWLRQMGLDLEDVLLANALKLTDDPR